MSKTIIILGSSRSDGNTSRVVAYLTNQQPVEIVDLNDYQISYFDYQHRNQKDDFIPLMEKLFEYDQWIFASPVYWYTMSAVMKTFFDRITDVLKIRRDLKPNFTKVKMFSLSCSGANDLVEYYHRPFEDSADYLNMKYGGHTHCWVDGDMIPMEAKQNLLKLVKSL